MWSLKKRKTWSKMMSKLPCLVDAVPDLGVARPCQPAMHVLAHEGRVVNHQHAEIDVDEREGGLHIVLVVGAGGKLDGDVSTVGPHRSDVRAGTLDLGKSSAASRSTAGACSPHLVWLQLMNNHDFF